MRDLSKYTATDEGIDKIQDEISSGILEVIHHEMNTPTVNLMRRDRGADSACRLSDAIRLLVAEMIHEAVKDLMEGVVE